MALQTPDNDLNGIAAYRITLASSAKTDLIACAGARSVFWTAGGAGVQMMLPAVPASGNPNNTSGTRLVGLIATNTNGAILDAEDNANTGRAGVVPSTHMPPYFYLENTSGVSVDVEVWVHKGS